MIELIQVHEPTKEQLAEWLKGHKITFGQYHQSMKTHYNNRMVTDYEKESKPAEPPPMERTKANFYCKMGSYDLKDGGITLEPNAPEPPPLSYTDERGILWRLIGEIPNGHGGKLGRYAPVFSETVAPKPLPWSQRFFRFFGRR